MPSTGEPAPGGMEVSRRITGSETFQCEAGRIDAINAWLSRTGGFLACFQHQITHCRVSIFIWRKKKIYTLARQIPEVVAGSTDFFSRPPSPWCCLGTVGVKVGG